MTRYVPSGTYFGRVKADGKLIRRSLETHVLEVGKLGFSDFLKDHCRFSTNGRATRGEVIVALKKAWPEFFGGRFGRDYSPSRFNAALQIIRRVFAVGAEDGYRSDNPDS